MSIEFDSALQSNYLAANQLDPSFDHYVEFLRRGYWEWRGRSEFRQSDLTVQVDLIALSGTGQQLSAARAAMATWSQMLPISFQEVAPWQGDVKFYYIYDGAYFDDQDRTLNVNNRWWNGDFNIGGYGYQTYIHEIGHALGLGHGGKYNGDATFSTDAQFLYDSWQFSIMSYFTPTQAGHAPKDYYLLTPRSADVDALVRKYFLDANGYFQQVNINTGNDTYGFNGKSGFALSNTGYLSQAGFTIHDTGGWDTLDFSGSTTGTTLNLNPGAFSSVNGYLYNVDIYAGHNANPADYYIEIGVGSAYNDFITGNEGSNGLYGNAGDDWMSANGGNDVLIGWTGKDAMDGGNGDDTLDGGPDNDTLYGGTGNDQLYGGTGNDALYGGLGWDRFEGGAGNDIFQFMYDIESGVTEAVADFTAGQDVFALSSAYIGKTYVQDTTSGVLISVPVGNNVWSALVYSTHDVSAVQHSFSYV